MKNRLSNAWKYIDRRINGFFVWLTWWMSLPPWLLITAWRSKIVRNIIFLNIAAFYIGTRLIGSDNFLAVYFRVIIMIFYAMQGIGYMLLMFAFLSYTKVIVLRPGEQGTKSFKDYYGNETLVETVRQYVKVAERGTERDAFEKMGGRSPRGLLFTGPPGTGKTLMAKCLASASKGAFIGMNGGDFMNMFLGVGMLKVMRMFTNARNMAKEYGSCVTPDTPILTEDLRWIRAGDVKVGDRLIGLEEHTIKRHGRRRMAVSIVEGTLRRVKPRVRVITDKGEITVTPDHPFLAHSLRGMRGNLQWTEAGVLSAGQIIKFLCDPWDAGGGDTWLAGMADGEGCLSYSRGNGAVRVALAQKPGAVMDRMESEVKDLGFMPSRHNNGKGGDVIHIGMLPSVLRFLGTVRPMRLLSNWSKILLERPPSLPEGCWATIKEVEKIHNGDIVSIQTSTRTYIANGFVSHNCVLFLDEIDAIGGARGGMQQGGMGMAGGMMGGFGGMGILPRLLTELDGLDELPLRDRIHRWILARFGVPPLPRGILFVVFATNRPDVLDAALIRPGRIDRRIAFDIPDKGARRAILNGYLSKIAHEKNIDVDAIAEATMGASPAMLEVAVTTEAVRLATFSGRTKISQDDIERGIYDAMAGVPQPISDWDEEQKRQVAAHEAGHALMVHLEHKKHRIVRASIIRRAGTLGMVTHTPDREVWTRRLDDFVKDVRISLAGHVATKIVMGEMWTGASGDFHAVRSRIQSLYEYYWFSRFPVPIVAASPVASMMGKDTDKEIDKFIKEQVKETNRKLKLNRAALVRLTDALVARGELSGEEVVSIIRRKK